MGKHLGWSGVWGEGGPWASAFNVISPGGGGGWGGGSRPGLEAGSGLAGWNNVSTRGYRSLLSCLVTGPGWLVQVDSGPECENPTKEVAGVS